ncbi:MAG: Lrp/AsnC family transcriptional regulator [Candidatus Dadabacteria bacterium]|nr:MAG: Lrp/AsnC family transcriptional regulator [Candidatus Dadabacteria bacterium]
MNPEKENELAKLIQKGVPLVERPYRAIAAKMDLSELEVIEQIKVWRKAGYLREISAVMEGSVLGYDSALVCGSVPAERLNEVARIISAHPTVTHNYERVHHYNLWFTIAVPKSVGLEKHVRALEVVTGISPFHILRRTHTFKIGVVFDIKNKTNETERVKLKSPGSGRIFNPGEIRIIRALQRDLPAVSEPFKVLADELGIASEKLLEFANRERGKALRRYVGTFRHRKLGVTANGMTVWNVPENQLEEKGFMLAGFSGVSHCYARNTAPGFPYSLYAMLHGPDSQYLRRTADEISQKLGCSDYLILESPTEFKKCRLRYFLPELDDWWRAHSGFVEESAGGVAPGI